ncbi:MAG: peptidoglycan DD-metalloendopeptidase family protein [Sandaracinus sp.]
MAFALAALAVAVALVGQARGPWRARRRTGRSPNAVLAARVPTEEWPAEPTSPPTVDPNRFASALHTLCASWRRDRERPWADAIRTYAAEMGVDPFVLAALVYRESRCETDADAIEGPGLGLTQIPRDLYAPDVHDGALHFQVREGGSIVTRSIATPRFPFGPTRLLSAEPNLYWAAVLLRMWRDQHETVDAEFAQEPHRHYLSHFVWGDRVRSDWEEERILIDRRRLLEYVGAHRGAPTIDWNGVQLGCPLDGCPRVILSWLGEEREDGMREHRGIDVDALPGEPVRAVADGVVGFAGVDLPGHVEHVQVDRPSGYDAYPRDSLGAGGRYVCIWHGTAAEGTPRSCYMHLETVNMVHGQQVHRGDLVGTVGRTGMHRSAAHLHLELHTHDLEDPSRIMAGLLLGHDPEAERRARRHRRHVVAPAPAAP